MTSIKRILYKSTRTGRKLCKSFYIKWNRILLYLAGVEYGKNLQIFNNIYIYVHERAKVKIGNKFLCSLQGGASWFLKPGEDRGADRWIGQEA